MVPELGHVGILFINGKLGTTKYYEYGRYASSVGNTRKLSLRDVKIMTDGHSSKATLLYILSQISAASGQNGRIRGAYIEVPRKYQAMLEYSLKRMLENSYPQGKKYDLISNSCNHFMKGVLDAAGVATLYMLDPRPDSYIEQIRSDFPKLDYSRAEHKVVVENPPKSLASAIQVYAQPAAV